MLQPTQERLYSAKDAVMLTSVSVILNNAKDNAAELTEENENWNTTWFTAQLTRTTNAFKDILGIDPKKDQREATSLLKKIQAEALPLLSTFTLRLQVAIPYAARRKELLTLFGFTGFYAKAQKGDQLALIELLAKFKTNITAAITTEITATKHIKPTVITTLTGFADTLVQKNINQETFKQSSKVVTAAGVEELNAIYTDVVKDFSKLVFDFYKKKKSAKKGLFSFNEIKKAVQAATKGSDGGTPPPTPPTT